MKKEILSIIAVFICILMPVKMLAQDAANLSTPEFRFEGDNLVMTCETQGANIYYVMSEFANDEEAYSLADALDVSEANSMRTLYTAPFPVTKNVVIKAVSKMPQQQGESEVRTIIYSYTQWTELRTTIAYGEDVLFRAKNSTQVSDDLTEELQWMLEEGSMFYEQRGSMYDSFEAVHITRRILEICDEIEAILNQQPAGPEPYAVLSQNNTVLTFYYDDQKAARNGMSVGPFTYTSDTNSVNSGWNQQSGSITNVVFDTSFANCTTLTSTAYWFYEFYNLTSFTGINNLKTDNVTDMEYMFAYCSSLTSLDVTGFNTQNVTDMSSMFRNCNGLTSINVSGFNTQKVTDMGLMFSGCSSLTSLDVTGFNTQNVTNMRDMFERCSGLTSLNVTGFNTQNVTDMYGMFSRCSRLTSLDVAGFNTQKANNMGSMFSGCSGLTSLDVSSFNTSNVTDMSWMFSGCSGLTSLDVSGFNTEKVTDMDGLFERCSSLTSIDVSSLKTDNVTSMEEMFEGCSALTSLNVRGFNTSNVTSMEYMFGRCNGLTTLDLSTFNTAKVTNMSNMFRENTGLTRLYLNNFNTSNVTVTEYMFSNCSNITTLDLSSFNTAKVEDMDGMFQNCSALTTIYVGEGWTTTAITHNIDMFTDCTALVGGAGTHYDPNHTDYTYAHIDGGAANPGYLTDIFKERRIEMEAQVEMLMAQLEYIYRDIEGDDSEDFTVNNTRILKEAIVQKATELMNLGGADIAKEMQDIIDAVNNSDNNDSSKDALRKYVDEVAMRIAELNARLETATTVEELIELEAEIEMTEAMIEEVHKEVETWKQENQDDEKAFTASNVSRYYETMWNRATQLNHQLLQNGDLFVAKGLIFKVIDNENKTCQLGRGEGNHWPDDLRAAHNPKKAEGYEYIVGDYPPGTSGNYLDKEKITLPDQVLGYTLTVIGEAAFNQQSMNMFELNESLEEISSEAFATYGLSEIFIPAKVKKIGKLAFSRLRANMQRFEVDEQNPYLKHTVDYKGVVETASNTLVAACEDIEIPEDIQNLGDGIFYYCSFDNKTLPQNLQTIGANTFQYCSKLTKIELPNTLKSLGNYAFYESGLQEISFPESITSIGTEAFLNCEKLETIYAYWSQPIVIPEDVFSLEHYENNGFVKDNTLYEQSTLYVPYGTKTKYQATEGWSKFQNIVEMEKIEGEPEPYAVLSDNNTVLTFYYDEQMEERDGISLVDDRWEALERELYSIIVALVFDETFSYFLVNVADSFSINMDGWTSLAAVKAGSVSIPAEEYAKVGNPNLLVYVNEPSLAPEGVQNVVIDGVAQEIVLTDVTEGNNNWFCPESFRAERISYTRNFRQQTEVGISRGWESIALPFTVQAITHEAQGTVVPFGAQGGKYFWLRGYSPDGLQRATVLEANTPYVISMPNNPAVYPYEYNLNGRVTFSAENTTVPATPEIGEMTITRDNIRMAPVFQLIPRSEMTYAINVSQPLDRYAEGSVFTRELRDVRPFEAVTYHEPVNGARPNYIRIAAQPNYDVTGIKTIEMDETEGTWYTIDGRQMQGQPQRKGVYIQKGKKIVR